MIAAGAVLYQLRNSRPYITKDFDIVISCIAIFAGGILVFQVVVLLLLLLSLQISMYYVRAIHSLFNFVGLAVRSNTALWPTLDRWCCS